jgi:predicted PurR-regulated permease PerM
MPARANTPSGSAIALWIVAVVAVVFLLRSAKSLFIPIALAVLISCALAPIANRLERWGLPRLAAASLVMLLVLAALGSAAYTVSDDARQLTASLPQALERGRAAVLSRIGGIDAAAGEGATSDASGRRSSGSAGDAEGPIAQAATGGAIGRGVVAVFELTGHVVVIFFLTFFLLVSGQHMRNPLVEIAGPDPERRRRTSSIVDDINAQIQRYLLVLLVTAVLVGLVTWLVLAAMGVRHAATWGLLAGILNSIPYFGPVLVAGSLFGVGMMQGGGVTQALQLSGAAIAITSLEGWLVTPPLMGKAERMSALAVFLGLLFWTWVWGGWGTILAVPMLVVIKAVSDHVDALRPVGRLMAP